MANLDAIREALEKLKLLLAEDRIDEATYARRRELILGDLPPEERSQIEGTPTPHPRTGPGSSSGMGPSGERTRPPRHADLAFEAGQVLLGQWRVVRELGRGGFGAVFEAEELNLHETHAVKVLDPRMVVDETLLERFRREVSVMRRLSHPRVVRVYDYREDRGDDLALISMELVAGCSVRDLLAVARAAEREVPVGLALKIFEEVLETLAAAHEAGVVHRDVTPGNILLAGGTASELLGEPGRDPKVRLVDFGIAGLVASTELSEKSRVLGTAKYVAPEIVSATAEIKLVADVYGAGAVTYELLTGETPAETGYEPVAELRKGIDAGVAVVLDAAVSARPAMRPTAAEAVAALEEARRKAEKQAAAKAERMTRLAGLRDALRSAVDSGDEKAFEGAASDLRQELGEDASKDATLTEAASWFEARRQEREAEERRQAEAARKAAEEKTRQEEAEEKARQEELRRELEAERQRQAAAAKAEADRRAAEEEKKRKEASRRDADEQRRQEQAKRQAETVGRARPPVAKGGSPGAKRSVSAGGVLAAVMALAVVIVGAWLKTDRGWILTPPQQSAPMMAAELTDGEHSPGAEWVDAAVGMRFRYIPPGTFTMGSPESEPDRHSDEAQHRVTITRGYWMGEAEVTQGQWEAVMGTNPSHFSSCGDDCPVEEVSWYDAVKYANALSRRAGLPECYRVSGTSVSFTGLECRGYRLPTEAEWEHGARAGGTQRYAGSDDLDRVGWYDDNSGGTTHRVGQKLANGWGLHDMSGNVWEWVWDWYGDYPSGAVTDSVGPSKGAYRVIRGGCWSNYARSCRSAIRINIDSGNSSSYLGFRLVRTAS